MVQQKQEEFTKYERARILGARALQIAMNAPLLIKINKDDLEKVKFDALKIAEIELNSGVLPISIKRPLPQKKEEILRRVKERQVSDEDEATEENKIAQESEIMELATPEDETEEATEEEISEEE
jgi:DNA-directed RNA polymerase subunit K